MDSKAAIVPELIEPKRHGGDAVRSEPWNARTVPLCACHRRDCITGVGSAVANGVYNANGKRIPQLPVTLDKLL
jgi:hypothetical protein